LAANAFLVYLEPRERAVLPSCGRAITAIPKISTGFEGHFEAGEREEEKGNSLRDGKEKEGT